MVRSVLFLAASITLSSAINDLAWSPGNCPTMCACSMHYDADYDARLRTVDCQRRHLASIPSTLPSDTQALLLQGNNITAFPSGPLTLRELIVLNLADNQIRMWSSDDSQLPPFEMLNKVERLDLSGNCLRVLRPNAFMGAFSLRMLHLSNNQLVALMPNALFGLLSLTALDLSDNNINSVHEHMWTATPQLTLLNMSANSLTALTDDSFARAPHLETLLLSSNRLLHIDAHAFAGLSRLRTLHLDNNLLSEVPSAALEEVGNSIVTINLSANRFIELPSDAFAHLPRLQELSITGAPFLRVVNAHAFGLLPSLLILRLHDNPRLSYIDRDVIISATSLLHLHVHNNNMTTLEAAVVGQLHSLRELTIYGNPLICDCALRWLSERLHDKNNKLSFVESDRLVCDGPDVHQYRRLTDLSPDEFGTACRPRLIDIVDNVSERAHAVGSTVRVPCRAVGEPRPTITWIAPNGIAIGADDSRLTDNGRTLLLQRITQRDEGRYVCVVSSFAGERQHSVFMRVHHVNLHLRVLSVGAHSAQLQWRSAESTPPSMQLVYRKLSLGKETTLVHAGIVTPLMHDYTLDELHPSTAYEVCLTAIVENTQAPALENLSCTQVLTTAENSVDDDLFSSRLARERENNVALAIALGILSALLLLACLGIIAAKFAGIGDETLTTIADDGDERPLITADTRIDDATAFPAPRRFVNFFSAPLHAKQSQVYAPITRELTLVEPSAV